MSALETDQTKVLGQLTIIQLECGGLPFVIGGRFSKSLPESAFDAPPVPGVFESCPVQYSAEGYRETRLR